jgi:hypothetical protein
VRRQGLEPRTRGLRARTRSCRHGPVGAGRCRFRRSASGGCAAMCRSVSITSAATEHRSSTAPGVRCSIVIRVGGAVQASNQRTSRPLPRPPRRLEARSAALTGAPPAPPRPQRRPAATSDFAESRMVPGSVSALSPRWRRTAGRSRPPRHRRRPGRTHGRRRERLAHRRTTERAVSRAASPSRGVGGRIRVDIPRTCKSSASDQRTCVGRGAGGPDSRLEVPVRRPVAVGVGPNRSAATLPLQATKPSDPSCCVPSSTSLYASEDRWQTLVRRSAAAGHLGDSKFRTT